MLKDQEVVFVPMTMCHAARALDVPLTHRDPFDELLLVQAQEEVLRLLTPDRLLADHPPVITVVRRVQGICFRLVIRSHDASLRRQRSTQHD